MFNRLCMAAAVACACTLAAPAAHGQQVGRLVLPVGTGNQTDTNTRVLAEALQQATGQTWIVENRAGAGGSLAAAEVARAKPDGLTLLVITAGHATAAALYSKLPYDSVKDFSAITMLSRSAGFVLAVRADSPYKSAQDYLDAARAQPGKISYGSFGVGNTTHVVGALFGKGAGVDLLHVPYKSPVADFLGGHVDSIFIGESIVQQLIKEGKVRALAISSPTRSPNLPAVPTFNELGVNDADIPAWSAVLGPAGLPPARVQALYQALVRASETKVYQDNARANSSTIVMMPPAEFARTLESQVARFKKQLPPLGIQLD